MTTIKAEIRKGKNENQYLRDNGMVPAVFYGPKQENTSIKISEKDFLKVYDEAGESSIITLNDGTEEHDVLIHDVQVHAVTGKTLHVDFYVIEKGKKVEVEVPIEFDGTSPAEKNLGGTLVKVMHVLPISAMPKNLPQEIIISVESLVDFDSQIKVSDIKLPEGVELNIEDEEAVVALIQAPKEEEEEPVEEFDPEAVQVEEKGKKEKTDEDEAGDKGEGKSE
jgi:large subunit ribosomal protein L25